jgi:O-antigen ligase
MMAAREFSRISSRGTRSRVLAGTVVLAVASATGVAVANSFLLAVAGLAAVAVLVLLLCRLDLVVALLAADFFFNAYVNHGAGIITIDKAIGALAVAAWILDWVVNRRSIIANRQLLVLGAFLAWTAVSLAGAASLRPALVTSLRYLIFITLYFLVIQMVRGDRRRAETLIRVVLVASTAASIVALVAFFTHHVTRASGPLKDPNDFGFLLASSVPLAIYQVRWAATKWGKAACGAAVVVILACTLATFSRSALTGLSVATLWVLLTGRLRLRWVLSVLACLAVALLVTFKAAPQVINDAFGQKTHVATRNVDVRFGYYRVEISEWEHYPLTGVGPGNFVYRFYQFAPGTQESLPYPSNVLTISGEEAYLIILAEQGTPGLVLFLTYLALSWVDLRRRFPDDARRGDLQAALAAGFIVACIGALFLAEQYYPPLWYLPALAAGLAASGSGTTTAVPVDSRSGNEAVRTLASGAGRWGRRFPSRSGREPGGRYLSDRQLPSSGGIGWTSREVASRYRPRALPVRWTCWTSIGSTSPWHVSIRSRDSWPQVNAAPVGWS